MKIRLALFLMLISVLPISANKLRSGLYFYSHLNAGTERTGLMLNDNQPFRLADEETITFDMYIRSEILFGFVTRIITNTNENIDLVFSVSKSDVRYPSLVVNETIYPIAKKHVKLNSWISVSIKLSKRDKSIYLIYDNIYKVIPYNYVGVKNAKVVFGACSLENFTSADTPPINIRNIKVYENETLIRNWLLSKHKEDICYDEIKSVPAHVINPHWLIDDHTKWVKIYSAQLDGQPNYTFDPVKGLFYIVPVPSKKLILFDTNTNKDSVSIVEQGYPAGNTTNQLLFDTNKKQVISYNLDNRKVSVFNGATNKWSLQELSTTEHGYYHHTSLYVPKDSSIISFGGYGYYQYNNLLIKINPHTNEWKSVKIPEIDPRYSPSSVIVGNELYVFGGRGCKSGRQDMSPHNYYDLYAIDLDSYKTRKVLEINNQNDFGHFLPATNMIFNSKDSSFYIFTNLDGGKLLRFTLNSPVLQEVSGPMNVNLDSDVLVRNLYYSPSQKKLYAFICKNFKNSPSEISIYGMNYPPIPYEYTQQTKNNSTGSYIYLLIVAGSGLLLILSYLIFRRRKVSIDEVAEADINSPDEQEADVIPSFNRDNSCICLLGNFKVVDTDGTDITTQFTPILKYLFLLLILYSEKNSKGISGIKLDELLWGDKEDKSARNNRNVSISKLRTLLERIGDVQIVCENNYWKIVCGKAVFCDYLLAMEFIKCVRSDKMNNDQFLKELLELLFYGPLLPDTQTDLLDSFKSDYSSIVIDILGELLRSESLKLTDKFKLRIVDTIFSHDIINEEALAAKCRILFKNGKKTLARNAYKNFYNEYRNLLGIDYPVSLTQILQQQ